MILNGNITALEAIKSALSTTEWNIQEAIRKLDKLRDNLDEDSHLRGDISAVISLLEGIR